MKNNKHTNLIVIFALIVAVVALTVGYAAFSASLNIESHVNVKPVDDFSVRLSSSPTSFVSGPIFANKVLENASTDGYGSEYGATANISTDGKTISDIKAYFTAPGQSVIYSFYAVNGVHYDAYLDSIVFTPANTKCTIPTGSNATMNRVQAACNNVNISIKVGDEPYRTASDDNTDIKNHFIPASTSSEYLNSELIQVKIDYTGNKVADGKFDVDLGSIKLNYTTQVK